MDSKFKELDILLALLLEMHYFFTAMVLAWFGGLLLNYEL